jgi:uncharacterized protein YjdB
MVREAVSSARPRVVKPLLAGVLVAGLLAGCTKQPASIKVKGPRDAVESTKMDPTFAPFEKKGDTIRLRASAFDKDGVFMGAAEVKWDSSDREVATVDATGLVTILGSGEAVIKATTTKTEVPLEASLPVKAVILDKVKIVLPEGAKKQLHLGDVVQWRADVFDDRGRVVPGAKARWRSNSYAATVTDTGEVEGRAIGSATIFVEAGPGNDRVDIEVLDWEKGKR